MNKWHSKLEQLCLVQVILKLKSFAHLLPNTLLIEKCTDVMFPILNTLDQVTELIKILEAHLQGKAQPLQCLIQLLLVHAMIRLRCS